MRRLIPRLAALAVAGAAALVVPLAAASPAQAQAPCRPGWRQAAIFNAMDANGTPRPGITFRIMTDEVHSQLKVTRDANFANIRDLVSNVYEQSGGFRWHLDTLDMPQQAGTTVCSAWNAAGTALYVAVGFYWPGYERWYSACKLYPSTVPARPC